MVNRQECRRVILETKSRPCCSAHHQFSFFVILLLECILKMNNACNKKIYYKILLKQITQTILHFPFQSTQQPLQEPGISTLLNFWENLIIRRKIFGMISNPDSIDPYFSSITRWWYLGCLIAALWLICLWKPRLRVEASSTFNYFTIARIWLSTKVGVWNRNRKKYTFLLIANKRRL